MRWMRIPVEAWFVRRGFFLVFLIGGLGTGGCTRYVTGDPSGGPQAYYQTAFPARDVSVDLERVLASIVGTRVDGTYARYVFSEEHGPVASPQASWASLLPGAIDTVSWSRSAGATAVVVASTRDRLTLLTTDHAIDFPDTIVEYFDGQDGGPARGGDRAIESISVKTRQSYAIVSDSLVEPFEILARSRTDDLALIGVALPPEPESPGIPVRAPRQGAPVLDLSAGDPNRLSWGSFVYLLGYPNGFSMVTRGIVSRPDRRDDAFLIDGLWNEGVSGGPILAVRGDGSGLEWVGIARAASARSEHRLVTEEADQRAQDPRRPYEGPVYLREVLEIRYGISFSVPLTVIRRFVDSERVVLDQKGYPVPAV